MSPDELTRLYRSCEPNESLAPTDPRYVNCDEVRGENLVLLYERALRRAKPHGHEVELFAGHRGVGKTSELLRLKDCLEKSRGGSGRFQVIYFVRSSKNVASMPRSLSKRFSARVWSIISAG